MDLSLVFETASLLNVNVIALEIHKLTQPQKFFEFKQNLINLRKSSVSGRNMPINKVQLIKHYYHMFNYLI